MQGYEHQDSDLKLDFAVSGDNEQRMELWSDVWFLVDELLNFEVNGIYSC